MFRRLSASPRRAPLLAAALVLLLAGVAMVLLSRRGDRAVESLAGAAVGSDPIRNPGSATPRRGGTITATVRSEPATFNRFVNASFPVHLLSLLTNATLVRVNPLSQAVEPWLAAAVNTSPDGRTLTVELRPGMRWSDGSPLTADDVKFSLEVAYDPKVGSGFGNTLRIEGKPIAVHVESPTRLTLELPQPYAPGARLLAVLPIASRRALGARLAGGTFRDACGTGDPPCPGLGPFVVSRYEAGARVVLARNPHYWRRDTAGAPLPYADGLTLEIVPDQGAELLRLSSGQVDLLQSELRPEDIRALRAPADAGRIALVEVGESLDRHVLWFNLGPAAIDPARAFVREDAFREAVSLAVDRRALADTVYLGAASPSPDPVTAGNKAWHAADLPRPAHDPAGAMARLDAMGLRDRDGDGVREDAAGHPVRFTVLVQAGISAAEKGMAFVRGELARVGVAMDVAPLDLGGVMQRWQGGQYDAIYHYLQVTEVDPAGNLDWWLSRGDGHVWHPAQASPATAWEAEIDRLMAETARRMDPAERVRLFTGVQKVMLAHNPVIYFAAPRVYVASSPRIGGVRPAVSRPQVLWNADELWVK